MSSRLACLLLCLLAWVFAAPSLQAASYYCDPATGSMSNPGSAASPWSTLQAVFTANKTFAAGDVIYLRSGYHGIPAVKGLNTGVVTIQPDGTATPLLSRLSFNAAKNWVVSGLDICPENAGAGTYYTGQLVNMDGSCSYLTLKNSTIRGANSIAGWTQQNWYDRAGSGLLCYAPYTVFSNNTILNTSFSVQLTKTATNSLVSHNTITNFYNDAIRGLSDFSTYEHNTIMNSFVSDANHDDCFQSWSLGSDGVVGNGTVYNVTIRNNFLMGRTDANQPLYAGPQGISNFDGFSENWVIENNVIFCSTYHGIALSGAKNCKIQNNTALPNPLDGTGAITPWITIYEHKPQADGTAWPVKSSGNLIRNNLAARRADSSYVFPATAGTADHNIVTTAYSTYFQNFAGFDARLLPTAPAVNAGLDTGAPVTDFLDHARLTPFDIGAYEYMVAADATNLALTKIMYHPAAPTTAERRAGFTDAEAFEFIELQNISPTRPVTLAGVRFTSGVTAALPAATLAPGARVLLVGNQAAFTQRYGTGFNILGEYQPGSSLPNTGARLTLLDAQGATIRDFTYGPQAPWPSSPDGGGYSLVLVNPASNPDPANAANWRASVAVGGSPGASDASTFTGSAGGDDNGDGVSNLMQYALAGTTPVRLPTVANTGGYLTLTFRRNLSADDARVSIERSTNATGWTAAGSDVTPVGESHNTDGTATYVWRSTHPAGETSREFLRLRVTLP